MKRTHPGRHYSRRQVREILTENQVLGYVLDDVIHDNQRLQRDLKQLESVHKATSAGLYTAVQELEKRENENGKDS